MRSRATILFGLAVVTSATATAHGRFLRAREAKGTPRARIACYPSATMGTRYIDPFHLGPHAYRSNHAERSGIVYTCRGSHIDIAHLRKTADWTAYLASRFREALLRSSAGLSYKMREPSRYHLQFTYPSGWPALPQTAREEIASEVAVSLAQHCAYTGTVWHEILTWFGYKSIGFYPEYESAFSWEDIYSNALGSSLAALALRDSEREYDEAMTVLIDRELENLGVRPRETARQAGQAVRGQWFVGDFLFCQMVKRNLDAGLGDGLVSPWLVPAADGCEGATPKAQPVPDLAILREYGFGVKIEIEPREWEKKEILRAAYPNPKERKKRIEPARHFGTILAYVRAQAVQRYGPHVDDCRIPANGMSQPSASDGRPCPETVSGDVNGDCQFDRSDLALWGTRWLAEEGP